MVVKAQPGTPARKDALLGRGYNRFHQAPMEERSAQDFGGESRTGMIQEYHMDNINNCSSGGVSPVQSSNEESRDVRQNSPRHDQPVTVELREQGPADVSAAMPSALGYGDNTLKLHSTYVEKQKIIATMNSEFFENQQKELMPQKAPDAFTTFTPGNLQCNGNVDEGKPDEQRGDRVYHEAKTPKHKNESFANELTTSTSSGLEYNEDLVEIKRKEQHHSGDSDETRSVDLASVLSCNQVPDELTASTYSALDYDGDLLGVDAPIDCKDERQQQKLERGTDETLPAEAKKEPTLVLDYTSHRSSKEFAHYWSNNVLQERACVFLVPENLVLATVSAAEEAGLFTGISQAPEVVIELHCFMDENKHSEKLEKVKVKLTADDGNRTVIWARNEEDSEIIVEKANKRIRDHLMNKAMSLYEQEKEAGGVLGIVDLTEDDTSVVKVQVLQEGESEGLSVHTMSSIELSISNPSDYLEEEQGSHNFNADTLSTTEGSISGIDTMSATYDSLSNPSDEAAQGRCVGNLNMDTMSASEGSLSNLSGEQRGYASSLYTSSSAVSSISKPLDQIENAPSDKSEYTDSSLRDEIEDLWAEIEQKVSGGIKTHGIPEENSFKTQESLAVNDIAQENAGQAKEIDDGSDEYVFVCYSAYNPTPSFIPSSPQVSWNLVKKGLALYQCDKVTSYCSHRDDDNDGDGSSMGSKGSDKEAPSCGEGLSEHAQYTMEEMKNLDLSMLKWHSCDTSAAFLNNCFRNMVKSFDQCSCIPRDDEDKSLVPVPVDMTSSSLHDYSKARSRDRTALQDEIDGESAGLIQSYIYAAKFQQDQVFNAICHIGEGFKSEHDGLEPSKGPRESGDVKNGEWDSNLRETSSSQSEETDGRSWVHSVFLSANLQQYQVLHAISKLKEKHRSQQSNEGGETKISTEHGRSTEVFEGTSERASSNDGARKSLKNTRESIDRGIVGHSKNTDVKDQGSYDTAEPCDNAEKGYPSKITEDTHVPMQRGEDLTAQKVPPEESTTQGKASRRSVNSTESVVSPHVGADLDDVPTGKKSIEDERDAPEKYTQNVADQSAKKEDSPRVSSCGLESIVSKQMTPRVKNQDAEGATPTCTNSPTNSDCAPIQNEVCWAPDVKSNNE